jgi:TetR/AcrR family transcriptional regulator, lmrAB and yxaGH operons repressor
MTTDSRTRMIRATARLLRRQGYHGTGLNQIVAEAEAPKGSMYFHFPGGKAQLAAEAVDAFAANVHETIRTLVLDRGSQAEGLAAYLDLVADGFDRDGFSQGCAIATVSAEAAPTEPALAEATGRALRAWTSGLEAGLSAEGHEPDTAHRLATAGVALIEGAIVMARGMSSSAPVREVRQTLRHLLAPPST